MSNALATRFCGLELSSPIVLLSGCVGFGEEYTRIEGFSNRDAGAIVLKGTTGAARLGNAPHRLYEPSAVKINVSCPDVKEGGVHFCNVPEMSARVVAACRRVTNKPLITKLSPNQTDIGENARRCIDAGTDAFAVINTVTGMAIDLATRRPVIGHGQGGLSGPAIKPIALLKVKEVYEVAGPQRIPIIGQGGITNAHDALEFII